MDLTDIDTIKSLLKSRKIGAKKRLGQHFLVDQGAISTLVSAAKLTKADTVLEIGPGIGVLTQEFCKKAGKVVAVEFDSQVAEILRQTCGGCKNLQILNQDILDLNLGDRGIRLKNEQYQILANLPYQITAPTLRKFLEADIRPSQMVLIVQREVAEKICASPGKMSILAVSVQFYSAPEIIKTIPASSFWPAPKVDSAIVKIVTRDMGPVTRNVDEKQFFRIVKIGFSSPRKKLYNNIKSGFKIQTQEAQNWLENAGVDPNLRPQELSIKEWLNVYKTAPPLS